jgi:CubicO group peptidase (beta-lactamase class C family)
MKRLTLKLAFCLICFYVACATAQSKSELAGIWTASSQLAPVMSGELSMDINRTSIEARIGGKRVKVKMAGDKITFDFGPNVGRFRGSLVGGKIEGFWIQPSNNLAGYEMATPVRLASNGKLSWKGTVQPLVPKVVLHLAVNTAPDGSSTAFIRDYQANRGNRRRLGVSASGNRVELSDVNDSKYHLVGKLDESHRVLTINIPGYGSTFRFVRVAANEPTNFYPSDMHSAYHYRAPVEDADGWSIDRASNAGMDDARLEGFVRLLATQTPTSASSPAIQAVLVARHGKLVLDEYFYGYGRDDVHDIRSAGKTLTTTLVGIAHTIEPSFATNTQVYEIFSGNYAGKNLDSRKKRMTIRDLVTMTSGYRCDDEDPNAPGNEEVMMAQTAQPDWTRYTLDVPMVSDPGGRHAVYCSADINLAGAAASRATATWMPALFDRFVAQPLDFQTYHWPLTPTGEGYGGGGPYLRPRDLLKIGQVYLANGKWKERQVVDPDWVHAATEEHSIFDTGSEATLLGSERPAIGDVHGYGYGWHILTTNVDGKTYREFVATGNGGQIVAVVPDLDLVVGFASSNYNNGKTWWKFISDYVPNQIIAAIDDR